MDDCNTKKSPVVKLERPNIERFIMCSVLCSGGAEVCGARGKGSLPPLLARGLSRLESVGSSPACLWVETSQNTSGEISRAVKHLKEYTHA